MYHDARSFEFQIHVKEYYTELLENPTNCVIPVSMLQTGGQTNGVSAEGVLLYKRRLKTEERFKN